MAQGFLNGARYDQKLTDIAKLIDRGITEVHVPEGVKSIGAYAFGYCTKLKRIVIPEGVTTIGSDAFRNCNSLTEITLPQSLKTIAFQALAYTYSLKKIVLPPLVTSIPQNLLMNSTIKEFIAEGRIGDVNAYAFANCENCLVYDFTRCTAVPRLTQTSAFNGMNSGCKIYVPASLYDAWIVATNWATYADHIVPVHIIPEIITPDYVSEGLLIENGVLEGRGTCDDSVIVIPDYINQISRGVFVNDQNLDTLILPEDGHVYVYDNQFTGSSVKFIKNISWGYSFVFSGAEALEVVSFTETNYTDTYFMAYARDGVIFDFTKCTKIPYMVDAYDDHFGSNTKIYVPFELYDEWIEATNWTVIADRIVRAKRSKA